MHVIHPFHPPLPALVTPESHHGNPQHPGQPEPAGLWFHLLRLRGPHCRQWTDATNPQQRQERKTHTDQESQSQCDEDAFHLEMQINGDGNVLLEKHRHPLLQQQSQQQATRRPTQSQADSLHHKNRKSPAGTAPQTPQRGHGCPALLHVHMDGTGHAQSSQHQRDESQQTQKAVKVLEHLPDIFPPLLGRLHVESTLLENIPIFLRPGLRIFPCGKFQMRPVKRKELVVQARLGLEFACIKDLRGNHPHGTGPGRPRRRSDQHPQQFAFQSSQVDGIADFNSRLVQQRRIADESLARQTTIPCVRRVCDGFAVKGKGRVHGPRLNANLAALSFPGREIQRCQIGNLIGHLGTAFGQHFFGFLRKFPAPIDEHITAHQGLGLVLDCLDQILLQRTDGHQRGNPKHDAHGKQQQPPASPPTVAPGHFPCPGLEKMKQKHWLPYSILGDPHRALMQ